jgi:heparosan-N-sulfate-glucuronate 5-epimerase
LTTPLRRTLYLLDSYALAPLLRRPSTRSFWYSPDNPNVFDAATSEDYLAATVPPYVIDYRPKLAFPVRDADGLVVLPYQFGTAKNPLASFMFALGLHDAYLSDGRSEHLRQFFMYARLYRDLQDDAGGWTYDFNTVERTDTWYSALAQSHGASVMVRAWLHSSDERYRAAALRALELYRLPHHRGGLASRISSRPSRRHSPRALLYFEEASSGTRAIVNGLMAALVGPYECAAWLGDAGSKGLWEDGMASLAPLLWMGTLKRWTLYSLAQGRRNLNSPHYHDVQCSWLAVLSALAAPEVRPELHRLASRWEAMKRRPVRTAASLYKAAYKVLYR